MTDHVVRGVPDELRNPPGPPPVSPDPVVTGAPGPVGPEGPAAGIADPDSGPGSMAAPIVDEEVGDPEQVNARCPFCGAPVSSAESFCEACGSDLAATQLNPLDLPMAPTPATTATTATSAGPATPVDPATPAARISPPPSAPAPADPAAAGPIPRSPWRPDVPPSPGAVSADDLDLDDHSLDQHALDELSPGESAEVTRRRSAPSAAPDPGFGPVSRVCAECGGHVGDDLYCEQCGTKAASQRDHFTEQPAPWVAGMCDRGIRHHRNEDAMALWAQGVATAGGTGRAVLVVCDGVSTSTDSDLASLAASRAARQVLVGARPAGLGVESSRTAAFAQTMTVAAAEANAAVVRSSAGRPAGNDNPASCTFVVGVVDVTADGTRIGYANIGDSRAYWLPDGADPVMLSVDDSVAQVRISMGVPREQAENSPQAHAITRWLGPDAPDLKPTTGSLVVTGSGWLLVCSDGLWNYASEPEELAALVTDAIAADPANAQPSGLAATLTQWANDQGGKDNITVALARLGDPVATAAPAGVPDAAPEPTPETAPEATPGTDRPVAADPSPADRRPPHQEATVDQEQRHG